MGGNMADITGATGAYTPVDTSMNYSTGAPGAGGLGGAVPNTTTNPWATTVAGPSYSGSFGSTGPTGGAITYDQSTGQGVPSGTGALGGSSTPQTPPSGGGGGSSGGSGPGYSPSFDGQTVSVSGQTYRSVNGSWVAQSSQPGGNNIDFDALIKPAMDALNAFIPIAQQGYQNQVGQANAWGQNQTQQTQNSMTAQQQTLNETKAQQDTSTQNAQQQARQMAAEIQQGIQSRYGGTTGTGAFAGELAGRQSMQNIGQLQQGLQNVHMQIADKLQQVQAVGQTALKGIQDQVGSWIQNAQSTLDQNLASIRQQQGTLQSQKAEMAATAMQHYQDTVNQINQFNAQQQNTVLLQQQQAESQLKIAQTYLQAYGGFSPQAPQAQNQTTPIGGVGGLQQTSQGGQLTPQQLQQLIGNNGQQGGQQLGTSQNPNQPLIR